MKLIIAALLVLAVAGCDSGPSDEQIAANSCKWADYMSDTWQLCMERGRDRVEARRNREDAIVGAALMNWANRPRSCMNIGGIVTCQ